MKQKIVIKVHGGCKKCWTKVMKIIAVAEGEIISVAWEGEEMDKVVVIGDGVDAVTLTRKLNKKLGPAELLIVEEVKEKKEETKINAQALATLCKVDQSNFKYFKQVLFPTFSFQSILSPMLRYVVALRSSNN
ncbi:hypothetical protein Dsin_023299 [Dipteronia sinensis]|uniref:HMA domain-containing protein n=1 Tax=Dipteronia sinensis TaxID=43782 RepID=A0AAE0E0X1_9ROSI|nr:hypothetical protein Dsin_023299 [Dipteronia sinensis]